MPSKQYLLQLGESALLAGLIAVDPIIQGQSIDWKLVLLPFVFAIGHSLISHVKNEDQRNTSNDILDGVERLISPKDTALVPAVRRASLNDTTQQ